MTKTELSKILKSVPGAKVHEGEAAMESSGEYPKIVYWETVWSDDMSSGSDYDTVVTYQISVVDRKPRGAALLNLRKILKANEMHPVWYHERVKPDSGPAYYHSYCSLEVLEDIE